MAVAGQESCFRSLSYIATILLFYISATHVFMDVGMIFLQGAIADFPGVGQKLFSRGDQKWCNLILTPRS